MISTLPIVLLALVSSVTSRPNLQRRGLGGALYYCEELNFRGPNCHWLAPNDECHVAQPGYIKSFGPDPDGHCTLYSDSACKTSVQDLRVPGLGVDLPSFAAFKCFPDKEAKGDGTAGLSVKALEPLDPRLAGGIGSAEREQHITEIEAMEADGFSEGLIGLKKRTYY
jgi:hypothetical protein